ncbi:diacylglycerol/lipid kinase family protein [Salegentibacter chungangensis]|uniref:Diacylglycerol/lipid kinase family protein n=1 Tax=Salegentibacter chungangensis TaxID=1335724 RepID=A0ABW3NT71_9FLAO
MEKIKGFLLIVNPISGGMNKKHLINEIEEELDDEKHPLEIYYTQGVNDKENIQNLIEDINPGRVLVAGGDGTIKIAAEAVGDRDIPLGIIPAGSANGLAVNLGLPKNIREQIHTALGEHFMETDILDINGESCLHMSDLGINAELIQNYEHSPIRGKVGYMLQSIPTLIKSKYPFEFKIETQEGVIKREGILLAFANASKYGTGSMVNPEGKMNDGIFEVLVFKHFDFFQILNTLRDDAKLDSDFIEIIPTKWAKVSCETPVAFQIDGEYMGESKNIDVKILPKKIKIAVPEK